MCSIPSYSISLKAEVVVPVVVVVQRGAEEAATAGVSGEVRQSSPTVPCVCR